jgi:hypothetical protein
MQIEFHDLPATATRKDRWVSVKVNKAGRRIIEEHYTTLGGCYVIELVAVSNGECYANGGSGD